MITIILLHLLAALLAPVIIQFFSARGFLLLALVPAMSFLWVCKQFPHSRHTALHERISWIPQLHLNFDQELNSLTSVFALLVLGLGAIVLVYCSWYFTGNAIRLGMFASQMIAFAGIMFALVTSKNSLMLFIFWELTSVLSFLLIGYYPERAISRGAAAKALLVTTLGGLAMLCGIIMLGEKFHSYALDKWNVQALLYQDQHSPVLHSPYVHIALILLLIGAMSKSALLPLHFWLPSAMVAPTPVSAYLHSAAMVKAGVFLIATISIGFSHDTLWRSVIITFGLTTMIIAGWFALHMYDLKLILAYGTISQLGFITTTMGYGGSACAQAGLALVIAHAFFKSTLFMVVGIIDHSTHTRDIRKLAGLGKKLPFLAGVAAIAALSMAGVPPLLGYLAKESALHAARVQHNSMGKVMLIGFIVGSVLTCAYTLRFWMGAFSQKNRRTSISVIKLHSPVKGFYLAPTITAAMCIVLALTPGLMEYLTHYYTVISAMFSHEAVSEPLQLWHGITPEVWITLSILAAGIVVYEERYRLDKYYSLLLDTLLPPALRHSDASTWYAATLKKIDVISRDVTRATQPSLATNLGIIFLTLSSLSLYALYSHPHSSPVSHDSSWLLVVIGIITCMAAVSATALRNRLAGMLVIGTTGYGCVAYFAFYGAPDLALTQAAAESLMLIFYILGVRNFGGELSKEKIQGKRGIRALLSCFVGATVSLIGFYAAGARHSTPLYHRLPEAAYHFSHGRNTVNVILVDIRAWDTLWESTVLLLAATGVVSLVFRYKRYGLPPRVVDALGSNFSTRPDQEDKNFWLASSRINDLKDRSIIMEVTTRLIFPSLMMFSLYLLFAGHNHPGGGFAAGLIAGSSITLRYIAGGRFELGEAIALEPGYFLGAGLFLGCSSAIFPLFFHHSLFTAAIWYIHLPLYGTISFVSPFIFDLGVYLIVIGVVLDVLRSLGARLDVETQIRKKIYQSTTSRAARTTVAHTRQDSLTWEKNLS